ncbi:MAG TPA: type II toxin-antitoxin system VapC family toxin [Phycisphaerae bacterium]|nr:type II toxin-antitoxin system VapC family toxin [Phycisphaerae bacterium]HRR86268.1 type II toxin-antitoxin system VapC family toxin [Phycisphaerae bacterium]
MKVFWDTNLFIYLIERHPASHPKVDSLYREHRKSGDEIIASARTLGELLAQPLRQGRTDLVRRYTELPTSPAMIRLVAFDRAAAEQYAGKRAQGSIRQPDAIQIACALANRADAFITNDSRLWGVSLPQAMSVRGL